ncbi:MAG: alpha/beta fold hydrolase [Burkholderiales bacterium]
MPRPTLFLLGGLLCDESVWDDVGPRLADVADVRPMAFAGFDAIPAMAAAVLDAAPATFAVAGHSLGGRVALELVAHAPERIAKLALLSTGVHTRRDGEAEARQVLVDLAFRDGMTALAARWLPPMLAPGRTADAALMARLTHMVAQQAPASFAGQVRALLARPDAERGLAAIACPTLLLCGRQDAWSPLAQHAHMAQRIAGSRLVAIEDCGHMSIVEQPAAVAAALREWLAG